MGGVLMIPWMLSSYLELVEQTEFAYSPDTALVLVLWLVAVAKFSDVGALLVGVRWGRTLMAPSISPKKTWEGFAGGIATSIVVGIIVWMTAGDLFPPTFSFWKVVLLASILAPLGALADLFKSVLKRQAGVKDSGNFLPGIGGALDLVDSLLFTAPIGVWFLLRWCL
jgi:phosphatidate cytidylyltransferase